MIKIDGDVIETTGQILRISVGLSAILKKPVHLANILKQRSKVGLAAQHLTGLHLIKELSHATVSGDTLKSTDVTFNPGQIVSGKYVADVKTAGSITLIIQVALPCILFGDHFSLIDIYGGTNVRMSPPIDYTINVFKPLLKKFGADFECIIHKRGFYPAGQGHVEISVESPVRELKPITLVDFGEVESITGEAFVSGVLPLKMAAEMAKYAEDELRKSVDANISVKYKKYDRKDAFGNGSCVNLVAVTTTGCYLGGSFLGERNVNNEEAGRKAAEDLLDSLRRRVCVDEYSQDQLIIFMALANGKSRIRTGPITSHTANAIKITQLFTSVKFNITELNDGCNLIECEGMGYPCS